MFLVFPKMLGASHAMHATGEPRTTVSSTYIVGKVATRT